MIENCEQELDEATKRKYCKLIYSWCKENLKRSKFHDNWPKLIARKNPNEYYKGYFKGHNNVICIYLKNNKTPIDLCETIIHEWKHYEQNIVKMYDKYMRAYGRTVKNHPYEISAENYSKKHAKNCLDWVEKNLK